MKIFNLLFTSPQNSVDVYAPEKSPNYGSQKFGRVKKLDKIWMKSGQQKKNHSDFQPQKHIKILHTVTSHHQCYHHRSIIKAYNSN